MVRANFTHTHTSGTKVFNITYIVTKFIKYGSNMSYLKQRSVNKAKVSASGGVVYVNKCGETQRHINTDVSLAYKTCMRHKCVSDESGWMVVIASVTICRMKGGV